MIVLAMDTSTTVSSAAISVDDVVVAEFNINNKNTHSKKFMVMVESMFEQVDMDISDVDIFAVAEGPGSFTGLRIGMTTAKTFAYALDKKIVGISSLRLMANIHRHFNGLVVPTMDARKERVFCAVYRYENGQAVEIVEQDAMELRELIIKINDMDEPILFTGDGALAYRDIIDEELGDRARIADMDINTPKASSLCQIVYRSKHMDYDDYFQIAPNYLRESQAQRQKRERENG